MRILENGLFFSAILGAALQGCGGDIKVSGGGDAGSSAGGATGGASGTTGGAGGMTSSTGGVAGGTGGTTTSSTLSTMTLPAESDSLALQVLRIGDTLPNGNPSAIAWKQYGVNIDGKVSTAQSVDLCKPVMGATPSAVYPDGDNGIDNGFGKNILPIMTSLASDFSTQVNDAIAQGRHTFMLRIQGISPGQTGTFATQLYSAAMQNGSIPSWQGGDVWPVRSDCLIGGDLSTPKTVFPSATVSLDAAGARIWQSVTVGDIDLRLVSQGFEVNLSIKHAQIMMTLSDDNQHATSGMIGGVLDTEAFIHELAKVAGSFDPTLCPPSVTFESIAQQVRQASDILMDGSQDPNQTCNGISIGLGFDADGAIVGPVFDAPVVPDPCNP